MNELTAAQKARLLHFSGLVVSAQNDVWDAFETGLMSDAKSAVFALEAEAEADAVLPAEIRTKLVRILKEAWTAISSAGGTTTEERAQKSHAKLGEAEWYIKSVADSERR